MNNLYALILYIFVVLLTLGLYFLYLKYAKFSRGISRIFLLLAILVPVVFSTIKYSSSPDYMYYLSDVTNYAHMTIGEYVSSAGGGLAEIGRWAAAKIGYGLTGTPYAFFTVYAAITIGAYMIVLSRYRAILRLTLVQEMLLATFITVVFYLYSLSVVAQMAAVPIFLIAVSYLVQKKYLTYLVICSIALCFHASILIVAPLAWLLFLASNAKKKRTRKLLLGVIFFSIIAILFSGSLVSYFIGSTTLLSGYDTYFASADGKYNNSAAHPAVYPLFGARVLLLIALALLYRSKGVIASATHGIPLVAYSLLCVVMFIPSPVALLAGRMGYFFDIFIIMAVVMYVKGATQVSLRAKVLLLVYCLLYFVIFYGLANWAALFPLDFIWNHPLTY